MKRQGILAGIATVGLSLALVAPAAAMRISGTDGDDQLVGTNRADRMFARAGADVVLAKGGSDYVRGGPGDDVLRLGPGGDLAVGDAGNDVLYFGSGSDGNENWGGHDRVYLGRGDDESYCFTPGTCYVSAGPGADNVTAYGNGRAALLGGKGRDSLDYLGGFTSGIWPEEVILKGDAGRDSLNTSWSDFPTAEDASRISVRLFGGPGGDSIRASGYTQVRAGRGDDQIHSWGSGDVITCGPGTDRVILEAPDEWMPPIELPPTVADDCETVIDRR